MPPPIAALASKYTSREEWLSQNDFELSNLWQAMQNYLQHTNSFVLDKCDFVAFCQFAADVSTHFDADVSTHNQ